MHSCPIIPNINSFIHSLGTEAIEEALTSSFKDENWADSTPRLSWEGGALRGGVRWTVDWFRNSSPDALVYFYFVEETYIDIDDFG